MRFGCGCFLLECKTQGGTEFDKEALQNNLKEIPLGYEFDYEYVAYKVDSEANTIRG